MNKRGLDCSYAYVFALPGIDQVITMHVYSITHTLNKALD
jgi:hypothetical protein